jgi:transketolase
MVASAAVAAASTVSHSALANAIRALSMDAVEQAKSGHPGMPMGMADVATVLFTEFLNIDPAHPQWPDRDRFVLSAGHGSMLQYALHYLLGYEDMPLEQLKNFRQFGARTAGHPEFGHAAGIETTTGPLGQGLANSVGMALAERMLNARYGQDMVDHYTYVIAGDGCLMEGISQEAISLAGHLNLSRLIVLFDDNGICIDGPTSMTVSEDTPKRFESAGWDVQSIDGHDPVAIRNAIAKAKTTDKPSLIACKTVIAYGAPTKAGKNSSHGSPLGADEIKGTREALGWSHAPFEIPSEVLDAWRAAAQRGKEAYAAWSKRFDAASASMQQQFTAQMGSDVAGPWQGAIDAMKKALAEKPAKEATRKSSGNVLDAIMPLAPQLVGGSADLTGSNLTKAKNSGPVTAQDYSGNYIYWGVREHGMAAAMNGLALHGGFVPFGGTFMVFTDYCRPSIRLSALMQQRVIYVMTHDSIGLGEDGPTHQPVEHLAALRAIPNLNVFRPCDAVETAEVWALSLASKETPSVLSLSRQDVVQLREGYEAENKSARGGYILREASSTPKAVIMATGTEVGLAADAAAQLEAKGIPTRVVSIPCWELFDAQPASYRAEVLGAEGIVRVAIEAALGFGWERYLGSNGQFIGMTGFGASAPADQLYKHFGITAEAAVKAVESRLK